jgi:CMP-N,N'-diacetyllegionaminic acid synthase
MSAVDPVLAVIPARGGSKGLPGKNIRPLAGLPLLAHSLECARRSKRIARVVVSTDSEEIAKVAKAHGGDVPFMRPPELAQDSSPMMPVLAHALATVEKLEGRKFGALVLLDPTSPGRLPEEIDSAIELLAGDGECRGVVACSKPTFNPFWVGVVEKRGYLAAAFEGGDKYERRQDVPPFFRINGSLYVWRSDFVREAPETWLKFPHRMLELPELRAFSIDDLNEFRVAESLIASGVITLPWLKESKG